MARRGRALMDRTAAWGTAGPARAQMDRPAAAGAHPRPPRRIRLVLNRIAGGLFTHPMVGGTSSLWMAGWFMFALVATISPVSSEWGTVLCWSRSTTSVTP
jgi:hypothetical protein